MKNRLTEISSVKLELYVFFQHMSLCVCVYRLSDAENMFLFILDSNDIGDEPKSLSFSFLHMELELVFFFCHFISGTDDVQS